MITIEEVIEYFEQNEYPPESFWRFKEPKEAAAVVRAQHEEIDKLKKESEIYRAELIDKAFRHVDRVKELQEEIERLRAERYELLESIRPIVEEVTLANKCNAVGGLVCIGFPEARIIYALHAKAGEPK